MSTEPRPDTKSGRTVRVLLMVIAVPVGLLSGLMVWGAIGNLISPPDGPHWNLKWVIDYEPQQEPITAGERGQWSYEGQCQPSSSTRRTLEVYDADTGVLLGQDEWNPGDPGRKYRVRTPVGSPSPGGEGVLTFECERFFSVEFPEDPTTYRLVFDGAEELVVTHAELERTSGDPKSRHHLWFYQPIPFM